MFWTIVFYIYLVVIALNVFSVILMARLASTKVFQIYGRVKFTKLPIVEIVFNLLRLALLCTIPGFNLIMLMVFIFWGETVVDSAAEQLTKRIEPN